MEQPREKGTNIRHKRRRRNGAFGRSEQERNDTSPRLSRGCMSPQTANPSRKRNDTPQPFAGLLAGNDPISIMMLAPDPIDRDRLAVREEYDAIDTELRALESDDWYLDKVIRCRVSEITEKLDKFQPNILHISSHGNDGALCFEDDYGKGARVNKKALAGLLATQVGLKLVVLNSCFSDSQAQIMADAVGHAVGMTGSIDDLDAIAFSREFYRACGTGVTLKVAVQRARYAVNLRSPKFAARLFTRSAKATTMVAPKVIPQISRRRLKLADWLNAQLFWMSRDVMCIVVVIAVFRHGLHLAV